MCGLPRQNQVKVANSNSALEAKIDNQVNFWVILDFYMKVCNNEEQIISGCPIDGAISVRVDGAFGSYRWFVYITTLLL